MKSGYYTFPTIANEQVVFVSEDDLWTVPVQGGIARRLTSNLGQVTRPWLSPDGVHLAFVGREEGQPEIYLMPALGGPARRLTFMGGSLCYTAGWRTDGRLILANNVGQAFPEYLYLYSLDIENGLPERINVGPARSVSFGPNGAMVIGRNTGDPARWKRYRGGTAGQLWVDANGDGNFRPLLQLMGNLASPMWIGERIYFLSDHEGVGNLYSCLPTGEDLRRHTDHGDFYARNAASDGRRIVYHAGADLYLFDPQTGKSGLIPVEYYSPQVQRNRRFVNPASYLEGWELSPRGNALAVTTRGKLFSFSNWEGPVTQLGEAQGVRYRLPHWLKDGKRLVTVTDAGGEERFALIHADGSQPLELLPVLDTGRPVEAKINPKKEQIAFSNHRYELMVLDLENKTLKLIDRGAADRIGGFDWSPDGEWLAYSVTISNTVAVLKLWNAASGEITQLTEPVLRDVNPAFDPDGKYLYFISYRHFDPVYDNLQFDLNFPAGTKPYLITLQKDIPSPFMLLPKEEKPEEEKKAEPAPGEQPGEKAAPEKADSEEAAGDRTDDDEPRAGGESGKDKKAEEKPLQIDLEGIQHRVVAFPVEEGRYGRIVGLKGGKVVYSEYPIEGALSQSPFEQEPSSKGILLGYSFEDQKEDTLVRGVSDFGISLDASTLIYRTGNRLRVFKAGEKPEDKPNNGFNRKTGWIDLSRLSVVVVPGDEWRQMFREAWRLQRDQFWNPEMSQVDWVAVHDRYLPLVERVGSRVEFSDLMWEMQGELGTSHCYEMLGDYRPEPVYQIGALGADFAYDPDLDGWKITHIVRGDSWDERCDSPLNRPGVAIQEGDVLLAINAQRLSWQVSPQAALVNLAGRDVTLTLTSQAQQEARQVIVKTLRSDMAARYREWVNRNRQAVHQATGGRVGYLHIPDMGAQGYAEFHRGFLAEVDRQGLIVDLRSNNGGHVSGLLLEKLARKRIGYSTQRWGAPAPYPAEAPMGPIVALTNEFAGSDGDIFSHGFKLMKLGPLLGKRTWGGVVGIWPRHTLVDGTITTQPEFSFWFTDVEWGVENYGTEPDIEVDNTPQDYTRGRDAQLERAISEILALLESNPPVLPDFSRRPSRALPVLKPNSDTRQKE
jgi:tricorn protease